MHYIYVCLYVSLYQIKLKYHAYYYYSYAFYINYHFDTRKHIYIYVVHWYKMQRLKYKTR